MPNRTPKIIFVILILLSLLVSFCGWYRLNLSFGFAAGRNYAIIVLRLLSTLKWASSMPLRVLLALAVIGVGSSTLSAQGVLQWKFKAGEKLHYVRTRDQTTSRTVEGVKSQDSILATTDLTLVVNEVAADRSAQVGLLIDRIRYQRKSAQGELKYDSSTDPPPSGTDSRFATNLKELLGSEFVFRMTPRGEIGDIRVAERTTKKVALQAKPTSAHTAMVIRNLLPYLRLPDDPVSTGKTWPEQTEYVEPVLGLRRIDITYRYVRPELNAGRPVEKIALAADVRFVALPKPKVIVDVKRNELTGTIYFDKAAGRLVMKEMKEKLSLALLEDKRRIDEESQATLTVKLTQ